MTSSSIERPYSKLPEVYFLAASIAWLDLVVAAWPGAWTDRIRSPLRRPASAAGEPGDTVPTTGPAVGSPFCPTMNLVRSYPATFFTVRPPAVISSPRPLVNWAPSSRSRHAP